jgi:hypothetical protein
MIMGEVDLFIEYARDNPELTFYLTPVGTGLAGYSQWTMRSMFREAPSNVVWADTWEQSHGCDE